MTEPKTSPFRLPKVVLITGATGLVGRALVQRIAQTDPEVELRLLSRSAQGVLTLEGTKIRAFLWSPSDGFLDAEALHNVECVVHLAGETVAQRWTPSVKDSIRSSRIDGLKLITEACTSLDMAPRVISASAIGGYRSSDQVQSESASFGEGFIEHVVRDWEMAIRTLGDLGGGHVALRIGLVLTPNGGVLQRLLPVYRLGLGSPLAPGEQWQSWVHIDDLTRMLVQAMAQRHWSGAYNAVGPHPLKQRQFSEGLAQALGRPHFMPKVPKWALRMVFGSAASALLASHRITPQGLTDEGFEFQHPEFVEALKDLLH